MKFDKYGNIVDSRDTENFDDVSGKEVPETDVSVGKGETLVFEKPIWHPMMPLENGSPLWFAEAGKMLSTTVGEYGSYSYEKLMKVVFATFSLESGVVNKMFTSLEAVKKFIDGLPK